MIRDLTIPEEIAELDSQGVIPWGTRTQADFDALVTGNIPEELTPARAALLGDNPLNPRDPDRFEDSVNFTQAESRNRFIPSNLANEVLLDVFIRTESFAPTQGFGQ